ncbi:MAG: hypothetical protein KJ804_20430 [Proteobacteria bacterium]|nr:hypothetical protein [Pseudomonadota bacterium]MBU1060676.1 hypothetical protein [Pseudomonadota bacterium]
MFDQTGKSGSRGKRIRSFNHQFRSCKLCGSADGLEISSYNRKNDIVFCQVCGVKYILQSVQPVKLQLQDAHAAQDYSIMAEY